MEAEDNDGTDKSRRLSSSSDTKAREAVICEGRGENRKQETDPLANMQNDESTEIKQKPIHDMDNTIKPFSRCSAEVTSESLDGAAEKKGESHDPTEVKDKPVCDTEAKYKSSDTAEKRVSEEDFLSEDNSKTVPKNQAVVTEAKNCEAQDSQQDAQKENVQPEGTESQKDVIGAPDDQHTGNQGNMDEVNSVEAVNDTNSDSVDGSEAAEDGLCDVGDGGAMRKAASKQTLHEAALHNNVERIRTLLLLKANVNAKDRNGFAPLYYALRFKKDELTISILIQAGADINGTYALHDIAGDENEESVKVAQLFLDSGADVAGVDLVGRVPLFYAAERGSSAMVELLLLHQSPIYVLDKRKETPLCVALKRRNMDILSLIFAEHHVQIFQEKHLPQTGGYRKILMEDLMSVEKGNTFAAKKNMPSSSSSAPDLRDLKQPSGLEKFFSDHSLKFADDPDSSQRNSYVQSTESHTSVNPTKHKRQVSFHTMSEICKEKSSKPQHLEEPVTKKKHRRRLSEDLRNELDSARQEAAERGKAAGARLKRKSFEEEMDLYLDLVENECLLHRTVQDIKACLRLGLGPNKTTQAVVSVIDGDCWCQRACNGVFYKPTQAVRDALCKVTTSGYFSYLVFFLLPSFLWYSDLILDIILASQLTMLPDTRAVVIMISWILALAPHLIVNCCLLPKRKYLLTHDLREDQTRLLYGGHLFNVLYRNHPLSVLISCFQGWPALVFYQHATLMHRMKQSSAKQVVDHARYVLQVLSRFSRWNRLLEDLLHVILQLYVALNVGRISNALSVKVAISCIAVSHGLVREEMLLKSPAKISFLGWTMLFLCFAFRFLHRIICIVLFTYFLTYWIILVFLIHTATVFCLQEYDRSVYSPKEPVVTFDRLTNAVLSIFHYIPKKTYEHSAQSVTRALFLASILVEDFLMFFIAYLYREETFIHASVDYEVIKYLAIVTLFALLSSIFLAVYYKYGHPWKWRTQRCCLE